MTDNEKDTAATSGDDDATSTAVELTEPVELTESGADDDVADSDSGSDSAAPAVRRKRRKLSAGAMVVVVSVVLLLVSAGLTAFVYFTEYRPDQQVGQAAMNGAMDAAKNGSVALLTYSPDTLEKDFEGAKANLTGDFLSYYTDFTQQIVTPAAKEKQVKTSASVVRTAIAEMHPDSAVVLVFINQVTTSKENPDGAFAASAVKVGLTKVDDRWLISAFDPV